jgi:hypothetical protein
MPIVIPSSGVPVLPDGGRPGELLPTTYLSGATTSTIITQSAYTWFDAGAFRHAVFVLDIQYAVNRPHIFLQTSNTLDDDGFVSMVDHECTATGTFLYKVASSDVTPLARYVRWTIGTGTSANWKITSQIQAAFKSRG